MRFLILFFLILPSLSFAKSEPCEAELATTLSRGPIQLDVTQSRLHWQGEDDLTHEISLAPRQLRVLRAIFVAGANLRESHLIRHQDWIAIYARLYPDQSANPATLQGIVSEINKDIEIEDPGMSYRLVTGRYRDVLQFNFNDESISVTEEEFTFLTRLKEKPNQAIPYKEFLAEAIRISGRWEQLKNSQASVNQVIRSLKKRHPNLPIEGVHSVGFRWKEVRWADPEQSDIWKFRGFDLDISLCRLSWTEDEQRFEVRLSPIECAVAKERFRAGEKGISWTTLAEAPNEDRLKIASVTAYRVAFTKIRNKIRAHSLTAAARLTSR